MESIDIHRFSIRPSTPARALQQLFSIRSIFISYRIIKHANGRFHVTWDRFENGKRIIRYVPQREWGALGIRPEMLPSEATARAKQLTAKEKDARLEERRNKINDRLRFQEARLNRELPAPFLNRFENDYLVRKYGESSEGNRARIVWRCAKKLIAELMVEPDEWADTPELFYRKFLESGYSFDYSRRILKMLNLWGYFYSKKIGKPFLQIPPIPRRFREEIQERFHDLNKGKKSRPLSPALLRNAKQNLSLQHYNWLYISLWFGLRPSEVDRLHESRFWKLDEEEGFQTLRIYQKKLSSVPVDQRWKVIPILCPEQTEAAILIRSGDFKRPLGKTIEAHTEEKIYTYGGRKGFVKLMRSLGRSAYEISAWMGHHSVDRTKKDYEESGRLIVEERSGRVAKGPNFDWRPLPIS